MVLLHRSVLILAVCTGLIIHCQGLLSRLSRRQDNRGSRKSPAFSVNNAVNALLGRSQSVQEPSDLRVKSQRGQQAFRISDRAVISNRGEQNARSIFGNGLNTEFVSAANLRDAAMKAESQAAKLIESTGLDVAQSFDANGNPLSAEVAEVIIKAAEASRCIFDKANTDPCTSKFREPTGRCSHVEEGRRTWGMAGTPYARLLPNKYQDGLSEYRTTEFSSLTRLAKSARKISDTVTSTVILLHEDFSAQLMQWGQFMAHEFTLIGEIEENVECCPDKIFSDRFGADVEPTTAQLDEIRQEIQELRGHICIAIENENDSVFGDHICMQQTRSTIAPSHDCSAGPRQQANTITHLMDGSAVYGSSKREADKLRSFRDGKMKVQTVNGHILPPPDTSKCPASGSTAGRCPFLGGDGRINTTPNLISMHTAFLVLHNKLADELKTVNRHWNDERIYQETRKIISGIQSSIHYNEFLPLILGDDLSRQWINNYEGYNSEVNPSVLNELAGAAFRFGHSIIDGIFFTINDEGKLELNGLVENFFNHDLVYERGATEHLRGLQAIAPWRVDNHFPTEMRDQLFNQSKDIVSFNINRGRDHGFASYLDYRRHYNLPVPSTWNDLKRTHSDVVVESLQQVYTTVEDIELYIGGVTEKPVSTGIVGELFGNIMGDGFSRIRNGDRLFYASSESGLTRDQIRAIDDYSLAQLLCEGGGLSTTSKNAFFQPESSLSEKVDCSSFTKLNLDLWKEDNTPTCEWQVVEISKCCLGEKTITRECVNESSRCKCEGETVIKEDCSCPNFDYICILRNLSCLVDFFDLHTFTPDCEGFTNGGFSKC